MMGGYRILGVHPDYAQFNGYEMSFGNGNNEITVKFAINSELLGDGPLIGGRQYPSYFTPPEGTLVKAFGQVGDEENLVDVVDAWGQPWALYDGNERWVCCPTIVLGMTAILKHGNSAPKAEPHTLKLASAVFGEPSKATSFLEQRPHMHFVPREHCFL